MNDQWKEWVEDIRRITACGPFVNTPQLLRLIDAQDAVVKAAENYVAKRDNYRMENNFGDDVELLKKAIRELDAATIALNDALYDLAELKLE